jgi:hypothetical protein
VSSFSTPQSAIHWEAHLSPLRSDLQVLQADWEGQSARSDPTPDSMSDSLGPRYLLLGSAVQRMQMYLSVEALAGDVIHTAAEASTWVPDVHHLPGQISVPL